MYIPNMLSTALKPYLLVLTCLIFVLVFISPLPVLSQGMIESWHRTYDSGMNDTGMGVAVDSQDNVIVTGYTMTAAGNNDYYTIKYDSGGNKMWDATYDSGRDDRAMDVAVDSLDNIIVTGWSYNTSGNYDYYTIKYDSTGNKIWDATYDSGMTDEVFGIAVDSLDNVIITGHRRDGVGSAYNTVKYDKNGTFLWNRIYSPSAMCEVFDVAIDSQDNVIVTGQCGYPSGKYYTLWYDRDGNLLRTAIFGIPGYSDNEGKGVAVDSEDNVIVTGMSGLQVNWEYQFIYRTVKYNKYGEESWVRDYGQPKSFPWRVAVDSHDNYVVTGTLNIAGNANYGTIKYDKSGNRLWVLSYYGGRADAAWSVAVDHGDNVIVTGGSKNASGNFDYYTIKYIIAPAPQTYTITASAGEGGSISPSGQVRVNNGASQTFTITANLPYMINDVLVDGRSEGAISTYTFSNVTANHTISALFAISLIGIGSGGSSGSVSAPVSQQGPMNLANLQVQSAGISSSRVEPGTPVTVIASVANKGTGNGTANIRVYVNGQEEVSKGVAVSSGSLATVIFTVSRNEPGTYSVYVGGVSAGSFTVDEMANPNIILYISIALIFMALVVGMAIMLRRKQTGY
jgi:hypothetical protein